MLTLAFAQIAWSVAFQWSDVTGGDNGIIGVWPSAWAADPGAFLLADAGVRGAGVAALRDDLVLAVRLCPARGARQRGCAPRRSASDARRVQWAAFVIAGGFAALAGALFAFLKGSVFPDNLGIPLSIDGLVMVLLGGVDTVSGGVVGAAAFRTLSIWVISHTDYSRLVHRRRHRRAGRAVSARAWSAPGKRLARRAGEADEHEALDGRRPDKSYRGFVAVNGVELRARSRRDARADRAERRRQDDLLQHDQRPDRADAGRVSIFGRRTDGLTPREIWRLGVGRTFQIAATFLR